MGMMRLRISGATELHGRKPGETFEIETDGDGVPLAMMWRKRLADEAIHKCGAVTVVKDDPPPAPATPEKKKG